MLPNNRYENDEREPDYETLKKLADFFNVSLDYLLGHETIQKEKILSLEQERLIKEITEANDIDLKELEQILNYVKSRSSDYRNDCLKIFTA